jgi:hypothetical protein
MSLSLLDDNALAIETAKSVLSFFLLEDIIGYVLVAYLELTPQEVLDAKMGVFMSKLDDVIVIGGHASDDLSRQTFSDEAKVGFQAVISSDSVDAKFEFFWESFQNGSFHLSDEMKPHFKNAAILARLCESR